MPTMTIPDDTFERLAKRAEALNVSVEQLVVSVLDLAAESEGNGRGPSRNVPHQDLHAWLAEVRARLPRYPPGFLMDDSRESIYKGCGE